MKKPVIESTIWQAAGECLDPDLLRALQADRLRKTVRHVSHVPFYKQIFERDKITPESIKTVDDVRRLPFTTKADLRDNYPLGFLAVSRDEVIRYHGSSGTTGKPTFVAYTRNDVNLWSDLTARFLTAGGLNKTHTMQVAFGYGLFTGGFGLHYGIERVGAAVIPVGSGNTERQLMIMQDLEVDGLICTPSYALKLADSLKAMGVDRNKLKLKFAHLGGEPWTEDMRTAIEEASGILCFNNYGLSEVIGPSVSGECAFRDGMHIQEDHFIVEVINPDTMEPVPDGEYGELVFTAITKEAFPLLRYRTRDIGRIWRDPCPCGRTTARMSRIIGRTDDMLIIRGVNVYPSQIEEALLRVKGTTPHYRIEVDRPGALDQVTVSVEMSPEIFSDSMTDMLALKKNIHHAIQTVTGLGMEINLVSPQTLERFEGKAKRVIDRRNLNHE